MWCGLVMLLCFQPPRTLYGLHARIQARSPFYETFVIQLAGQPGSDGGTYLCTARGEEGRGYSASMYCNLVSPKGGQELVDRTVGDFEADLHGNIIMERGCKYG